MSEDPVEYIDLKEETIKAAARKLGWGPPEPGETPLDMRAASQERRRIKIEALRAAAVVQAGWLANSAVVAASLSGVGEDTIDVAEQFRAWLEEGS